MKAHTRLRAALWIAAAVFSTHLQAVEAVHPPAAEAAHALHELVETHFERTLELAPLFATAIGDSRYDDRLGNPASTLERVRFENLQREALRAARALPRAALSPADRLTLDIFIEDCERTLAAMRFPSHLMPITQLNSVAIDLAVLGSGEGQQPLATTAQHEAWLKRAAEFPAWVDAAIANMRLGVARGVTLPRRAAEKVLPQLRVIANTPLDKSVFRGAIARLPQDLSTLDRNRLVAAYEKLIGDELLPAYRRLADYFEHEYLPRCRASDGWSGLPDGAAWYRERIGANTGLDLSAEQIHRIGLAEVARIRDEMDRVRQEAGFAGDLKAFFAHVASDPRFYARTPEEIVERFVAIKRRVDPQLPQLFSRMPVADYEVRPIEAFRANAAPGAFYQAPSADGKRPGVFYINTHDLRAVPIWGMETLSLHEASPGHHFQMSLAQEITDLPRFRRFRDDNAYAEGWALYAETLGRDLGLFSDPYQRFGKLNDEMLRASRLVVDTGLHAMGWSRERAIAYMQHNQVMSDGDAVIEVERYMADPGQALGYKLGQLRILALRRAAEQRLGTAFDVRAFHREVLVDGALPIPVLEQKLREWIARTANP
ncbi:DUF885 domain-containing protein [Niveibacterium umoris]|uniref:Uncharacterized protein (DUF885 family) n=1 Tax=Niveibacterium umoris TaxID=1193620 RepID=A0A840BL58_9RHOO|nr:DUF885 domain-containing protein [Niveibacterium umoris]MBB4013985.1 uncharacterized protein (DUF885 family) [Niveibacterium umoris]